jgi:hypothetical protein
MHPRRFLLRAGLLASFAILVACRSAPEVDPRYRPAENVLEVVAVMRAHVADDTYRFAPARDFTGRNVYRSTLLRLESIERLHANALRAGHMDGVTAFTKARALERLRAYSLAAQLYLEAAEVDATLSVEAQRSADVCAELDEIIGLGVDRSAEIADPTPFEVAAVEPEAVLAIFEERTARLEALGETVAASHHYYVVQEEIEYADVARARYFKGLRKILVDGDVRAVAEAQRLIVRHADSKNLNRHMLGLADLYVDLAVEYADANPPAGLTFEPARFQELTDAASRRYEMVASQDGTPEKLEASRRLEAFLAFALAIDNDRFTP